ncbi:hypothetical protein BDZ89DRAFT_1215596 [Hymenopellis radicata]|nr:hypothetical protein BDZ89DRAFT_1215596 [Hymenopellis radicata]
MSVAHKLKPIELARDAQNKKRWGCPYEGCTSSRDAPSKVLEHMNTHIGHKPFKCPEPGCSFKCSVNTNLSDHCKSHHGYRLREFKSRNSGRSSAALNDGYIPEPSNIPQPRLISFVEAGPARRTYQEPVQRNHAPSQRSNVFAKPEQHEGSQRLPPVLGYCVPYDPAHPQLPPISSWYTDDRKRELFTKHPPPLTRTDRH